MSEVSIDREWLKMKAIIHNHIEVLEGIMPKLKELKNKYHEVTIFQDIDWLKHWWKTKRSQEEITPYVVEITENNETIGVIPMYLSYRKIINVRFRVLKPIGMGLLNYILPILSKSYCPKKLLKVAFEKVYEDKNNWDCIHWGDLPKGSNLDLFLKNKRNKNVKRRWLGVSPRVELNKDIEVVKSGISKKLLKGIFYNERRLKREGELHYHVVTEEQDIEPIMNKLYDFHRKRWVSSSFRSREERELLMSLVRGFYERGLLHLSYLSHNETIAAVELGVIDQKNRYLIMGVMNPDFHKYSIGNIITYKMIEEACAKGYEVVDFLCGYEEYKQRWSTVNKINLEYLLFNNSKRSLLYREINNTYYSNYPEQFLQSSVPRQVFVKLAIRGSAFLFAVKDELSQKVRTNTN